jgi:hypothetical protein
LLSVAESFLRNTELATHEFGTQVYLLLFEEFVGDFFRREVCSVSFILVLDALILLVLHFTLVGSNVRF